ncbi:MAG: hypothetical protein IJ793_00695 [Opitutales bacterium]|nr:hypothetical protein [Opitutales bacterium]
MLILLSGLMIGSTLFAVPKKRETDLTNSRSPYDMGLMMYKWLLAQPTERAEAEYYSRMETEALQCMPIEGRYDRLMLFERTVNFPLKRRVSKTFLSMLKHYLPDGCTNAKAWRNRIVTMMLKFRSGQTNIEKIKAKMHKFCVKANSGEIVFAHYANGCIVLNLVLYELERLMGIVQ